MRLTKITIVGNSVALRVRPPQNYPNNLNYGQLLEKQLNEQFSDRVFCVTNTAFHRATLKDIFKRVDDIFSTFPDLFILNVGIPDLVTREMPFWFAQIIYYKRPRLLYWLAYALYKIVLIPLRPFFVRLRGKRSWFTQKQFERNLEKLVKILRKETNALIILLGLQPTTTERVEKQLPGTKRNLSRFSPWFEHLAQKFDLIYVPLPQMTPDEHFPDGIHFSHAGHKLVAQALFQKISELAAENKI